MTQKAYIKLEVKKNDRMYYFEMPIGSPFGESYDAAHEFLQEITKLSYEAADRVKREDITLKTDENNEDKKEEKAN